MDLIGPGFSAAGNVERILRSLPDWFGIEESLQEYVRESTEYPTFLACRGQPVGFMTVRQHFARTWEVHCMAVHASERGKGIGRALHAHVEAWLIDAGARFVQVKTLAATHPSPAYAQTRAFYSALGYLPLEQFPLLWGPGLPVLQLVKALR